MYVKIDKYTITYKHAHIQIHKHAHMKIYM